MRSEVFFIKFWNWMVFIDLLSDSLSRNWTQKGKLSRQKQSKLSIPIFYKIKAIKASFRSIHKRQKYFPKRRKSLRFVEVKLIQYCAVEKQSKEDHLLETKINKYLGKYL